MIKIFVQTREKGILQIDINSVCSIEQLKYKIQKKEGTPVIYQCILYKGEYLEDNSTLKYYSLINGSTVLLFNKKKSLLLKSSNIFNNSTFIDRIRQSCIDLEVDTTKEETVNLLKEATFYLDKIFDAKTTKELFALIISCFRHFPEKSLDIISERLNKKSVSNNLYLIITSVLSFLEQNHPEVRIQNFEWFILNVRKEILPQIQNKKNSKLILYDQEVDPLFQTELISDIALLSDITEENISIFYPIILNSNLISKMNFFIQKVSKASLLKVIPESEFLKDDLFLNLSPENLSKFISISSEQTFRKILSKIEENVIKKVQFLPLISNPIIEKCIEFDINMKSINVLFDYFTNIELILKNLNYLNKYKIQLPEIVVSNIKTFPKSPLLLKVVSHIENLPDEILSFALNESNDIESYEFAFKSDDVTSPTLSTLEFWKHILNVVSNSSNDYVSNQLLIRFAIYLEKNVPLQKFDEFYDHLIFDNFPPNKKQSIFLYLLFKCLKVEYRNVLLEENRNEQRIERFFNQKMVPHYSLYKLFNFIKIISKNKNLTANQIYALYQYDSNNIQINLDEIEFNLKEEAFNFLTDFIKKNDFDLLTNIDNEETLLFITHSLVFGSQKFKIGEFKGITKGNILPIFAISLNSNLDEKLCHQLHSISKENFELLIESCNFLIDDNVSQLYIESINAILSNYHFLFDNNRTHFEFSFKLIDKLCYFLINNKYKADKKKLILTLFKLSCDNDVSERIISIFQKYEMCLLKYFLQNKKEIINYTNENKEINLNLDLFESNQLQKVLIDEIQQLKKDELIQTIYFLNNICIFVPQLKFDDLENIKSTFQILLNEEKWTDLMTIIQFTQYHRLKVEEFTKHDDLIKHILKDPEIENHQYLFDVLFIIFMKDSYFANKYATCILERCTFNITINPALFLEKESYVYYEFKDIFDRVFNQLYAFFPKDNIYDYKILIVRKLYKPLNYSVPGIDCSFIKKLIEEKTFQSFLCLHKIASYFPFLFEKQFYLIINAVLPILNSLHLLFDKLEEESVNNVKVFYSAFSFLISCLYSAEFFSSFCIWLFENFTKLSNYQVFCMSSILFSLFQSDLVKKSVLSLAYKYNFLDIIINLLSRDIEEGQFKKNYIENLFNLSKSYISYFFNVSKFHTFIFFDMVKNSSIRNPFEYEFNNFSATPLQIDSKIKLNVPSLNNLNEKMENFFNTINEKHRFMILYSVTKYTTNEQLSKFLDNFKDKEVEYVKTKGKSIPYLLTVKMIRYLCLQPKWVFNYFCDYYTFARLPEHFEYLEEIAFNINKMSSKKNTNDELCPRDFNPSQYFTSEICNNSFDKFIMNEIETNNEIDDCVYDLISLLVRNEENMISFLNYISETLVLVESNLSFKLFNRITRVINCIIISNTEMSKYFFSTCGNKFIHVALSPIFRSNESTMLELANSLLLLGKNLPIRTIQIIGFICTLHPVLTSKAMALYDKLIDDKSTLAFNLIKNVFANEKQKDQPNFNVIKCYIEKSPSMMKKEIPFLLNLVPKYITRFINENYLNNELFDVICLLLNFLSPERKNEKKSNYYSITIDEVESKNNSILLFPPSNNLIQTSKDFWLNIYDKNRSFLSEMIKKNEINFDKFIFLHEFHELVSFKVRLSYFRRKAKEMTNNQRTINFRIKRSSIVQDTFNTISNYKSDELLCRFKVFFINEYGIDDGGLTREWFSNLIKELFNPEFGLFIKSGNESYFPNSLSYINNNHIDYFKFAGKIIGLALMKNQYVNAHLSLAFIRQILHQDVVFKDLENYDESLMKSLQMILDADDVKNYDLFFSIDDDQFGKIVSTDLIKNGSKTAVTNQNRTEYVNLYADYKLRKSVIKQITAFCDGFDEIVPHKLIQLFTPSELNLMICGIPKIDINDMKKFTLYNFPYNKDHPVIQMFFKMLTKWSHENLAKLLLFVTGSSQVPINGFKDFLNSGNPICISPGGTKDRLPVAHTCSNMLCLPYYDDENDMNNKLLIAIQHCEFGFM